MSENNNIYNLGVGITIIPTIEINNLRAEHAQLKIRIEDLLTDKQNLQTDKQNLHKDKLFLQQQLLIYMK